MLSVFGVSKGCLTPKQVPAGGVIPESAIWIDLYVPAPEEEQTVEEFLKIDIPTREELAEIEASSRLYLEEGATFMTATLIRRGDDGRAEFSPSLSFSRTVG